MGPGLDRVCSPFLLVVVVVVDMSWFFLLLSEPHQSVSFVSTIGVASKFVLIAVPVSWTRTAKRHLSRGVGSSALVVDEW
jgi:hypothetical protein